MVMHRKWLAGMAGGLLGGLLPSLAFAGGVLVVAPHPDDDILIGSGVIANAVQRGDQVKVVFVTNGDYDGITQGYVREAEAVNAQVQNLGTTENDLIFLGYPDGSLATLYSNYTGAGDQFWSNNYQSQTYGSRGLGGSDYHTYKFGAPGLYNRANMLMDLESIISTYKPDHIVTVSEHDRHTDHSTTYELVKLATNAAIVANTGYKPTIHKTIVWDHSPDMPAVWPEPANPTTYHVAPSALPAQLDWSQRESIDVPLAMQNTNLAGNPKYRAIDANVSQGGAQGFIGRFLHKDEIFWVENPTGGNAAPRASAGSGQVVEAGAFVQLNGTGSADPEGATLTYHWRQIGGTTVSLSGASSASPSFTAPGGLSQGDNLSFELVVSDGTYSSLPDLVVISVMAPSAGNTNVAASASVTASSQNTADGQLATKAIDGVADGYPGDYLREWSSAGQRAGAWIELHWTAPVTIDRVVLFDRPNMNDWITSGVLTFSDGSSVQVSALNNDGSGSLVRFATRTVTSVRFTVNSTSSASENIGLAEFQVFGTGSAVDQAPTAKAGSDQAVAAGATVQLDGSASVDPEGAALTYHWQQIGGTAVTLSSATAKKPTFTAPSALAQNAVLTFQLVVNDGTQDSAPDTVEVTVYPNQASINVAPQASVTASSQNSADGQLAVRAVDGVADGYPGDYSREWATTGQRVGAWIELNWSAPVVINRVVLFDRPNSDDQITGATLTFDDGSSVTVPALNNNGSASEITFSSRSVTKVRLTVTSVGPYSQNIGLAEMQVFTVGSAPGNQAPIANAGAAQVVAQGSLVQLDGSASSDPEGAELSYRWRQIAGPAVTLSSTSEETPLFVAPSGLSQNTTLSFELVVNDGLHDSLPSVVNLTVTGQSSINIAGQATVVASSQNAADAQLAVKAVDGVISGYPGDYTREWATQGEKAGAWIELRWNDPMVIDHVVLYDRPNSDDQITGATLTFSDGSSVSVGALNNNGTATTVNFTPRTVTSLRLTVTSVKSSSQNIGLSEFEVFGVPE